MEIKQALEKLQESNEFKKWRDENKEDFMSYAFCQIDKDEGAWQIGYHNKTEDKITTFIVDNEIKIIADQEIFKKPEAVVNKLDLDKVKLSFSEIMEKVSDFQKKEYSKEIVKQKIVILQNLEKFGNVWNITLITMAFNMLNMKLSAEDGKILHHKISSILDLRKE